MTAQRFFFQLVTVTAAAAWGLFLLQYVESFQAQMGFSWSCLGFFVVLSTVMFFAGKRAAQSKNKNDFTGVALGFTIIKLFAAILIILFYSKGFQPQTNNFILPFIVIYVIYTAFETYFMMQLGKMKT